MKAVLIDSTSGIDAVRVGEIDIAAPAVGEIQIAIHASSVNFPDVLMTEGAYQLRPPLPFVPGMEGAGVVVAVGPQVEHFKIGDRVLAAVETGAFAERLNAPAFRCFVLPDAVRFEDAAAIGLAYQTAHFALCERGTMSGDDIVLINGATGGVGLAAIRLAKALGARTVIASVASPDKKSIVIDAGADFVVDVQAAEQIRSLKDQITAVTGGRLADLIIDSVGGSLFEASLRALAFSGRLVIVGFAGGTIPTVKTNYLLLKNISIIGLQWALYPTRRSEDVRRVQSEIFDLFLRGKLDANIGATYGIDEIRTALGDMKHRKVRGKIVIRV